MMTRILFFISTLFFVIACGGGGSSSSEPSTTEPPAQPIVPQLSFTTNVNEQTGSVNEGDTVTFSATVLNTTQSASFTWRQTYGPSVDFQVSTDGSEITFVAPDIFQVQSELIEIQVNAVVNGIDSGSYGASINIINEMSFVDFGYENSLLVFGMAESNLQLMNVIQTIVEMQVFSDKDISLCSYDSVETLNLIDNDENTRLSAGDIIEFSVEQCDIRALASEGYGRISIEVTEYDQAMQKMTMVADFSRFFISDYSQELTIDGRLNFVIDESNNKLTQTISNNEPLQFLENEQPFLTINESSVTRVFDYENPQVTVSVAAKMLDFSGEQELTITQTEPFVSDINELPKTGELIVSNSDDAFSLKAAVPVTNNEVMFESGSISQLWYWNEFIEGTLFKYLNADYWYTSFNQNFQQISTVSSVFKNNDETVSQLLFNKKLDPRSDISIPFRNQNPPYETINLVAETQGAILNINQPEDVFLEAASWYYLCGFNVVSENLQTTSLCDISINTQSDVIPKIKGTSIAFRENDYPNLNASDSVLLTEGEIERYEWFEVTDYGVVFDTPNAETTTISIPTNVTEDVQVGLKVTNNSGKAGEARQTLTYIPLDTSFILLDSAENEYIGQGKQWVIVDNNSFTLRFAEFYENSIDLQINGVDFFFMNVAPKDGDELTVGEYENANRFPFQPGNLEGFDFSGAGRGCNQLTANFEIFEFTVVDNEIQSLSLDFTQYCENFLEAPLKGKVRINTNSTIN